MFEILSYKASMEPFLLADRFQNNIELSDNICILVLILVYSTLTSHMKKVPKAVPLNKITNFN